MTTEATMCTPTPQSEKGRLASTIHGAADFAASIFRVSGSAIGAIPILGDLGEIGLELTAGAIRAGSRTITGHFSEALEEATVMTVRSAVAATPIGVGTVIAKYAAEQMVRGVSSITEDDDAQTTLETVTENQEKKFRLADSIAGLLQVTSNVVGIIPVAGDIAEVGLEITAGSIKTLDRRFRGDKEAAREELMAMIARVGVAVAPLQNTGRAKSYAELSARSVAVITEPEKDAEPETPEEAKKRLATLVKKNACAVNPTLTR